MAAVDDIDNRDGDSATTRYSPIVDRVAMHNLIPWLQMLQKQWRQRDGNSNRDGDGNSGSHGLQMHRKQRKECKYDSG